MLQRRDRQIRYIGCTVEFVSKEGTVKFVSEVGPSNLSQRTDRQICFRGRTVKFVTEDGQSNSLHRVPSNLFQSRDRRIRYNGGT